MRYDNRPKTATGKDSTPFYVAYPYRNPTIGWMSDIQAYTRVKMENHVRRFYTPDNALLVLVGNIDSKKLQGYKELFQDDTQSISPQTGGCNKRTRNLSV